ncbi:MAG: hypothetical protein IJ417_07145 [Bacteroidaceae bacterium]|nr:hypothetical protein [Bacteroidaceae bacterium]
MTKNNRKTKNVEPKKQKAIKQRMPICALSPSTERKITWITPLLFCLIVGCLLCTCNFYYLHRIQELSLFLPTQLFWEEQMRVPGGCLNYVGCFLTQFFYYPWLGTLLLIFVWLAIYGLTHKILHIPNKWALLTLIPIVALLASNTQLGYWIYYLKSPGYFFSHSLGFITVLLAYGLFKRLKRAWVLLCFLILWIGLGYPLFGFYALLGGTYMIFFLWIEKENQLRGLLITTGILAIISLPLLWYYHYTHIRLADIYITALPQPFEFSSRDISLWIPFILLTIYPIILIGVKHSKNVCNRLLSIPYWINQTILLIFIIFTVQHFWYRDSNFRAELTMHHAIEKLNWEKVLDIARESTETPTRLMVMNKNLALFKLGRAGNEMYKYPDGGKAPKATMPVRMIQIGGRMLYMHYGKENFCYRWCLEDAVEFGMKVEYLKFLIKTSLLSGEYTLANKYISILEKTFFYKDEAQKLKSFVRNPELLEQDAELGPILPMMCYQDVLDGDQALIELYLLNYFSHSDGETRPFQEQTLLSALQMKDIQLFWPRFFRYANLHQGEPMPIHYQEAALLYGTLEKNVDISRMPFDPSVKNRFNEFMSWVNKYNGTDEKEMEPFFKERFGDTFFYHYFFVRGVKSY